MSRSRPATLWSQAAGVNEQMLAYTVGNDREIDTVLLRWDVLGSLGHVEGLRRARIVSTAQYQAMRRALLGALRALAAGRLSIGPEHEDGHSALETWMTDRYGPSGERLHTGRSRNDQVAVTLRLWLKHELLGLHDAAERCVDGWLRFAARHRGVLWPGYTHSRRAMPSSLGLWAGAYAEGVLDGLAALPALWSRVDRSPLGSAAGYGVPLPLDREAAARALGFGGLDWNVATVQNSRGKLEAAVLFWCLELAHDLSRYAADVILYTAEEYGYLTLPADLATGSSIMPHKHNPDLFELTRARAAALEGDLATVLALKAKLTGGYHRDFQMLKEPVLRGVRRTREMLDMMATAIPRLVPDPARCRAALAGDTLATDEVMRRVAAGRPFRAAYREVSAELRAGRRFPELRPDAVIARRGSAGGLGNLGLDTARARLRRLRDWRRREARRFTAALTRLTERSR